MRILIVEDDALIRQIAVSLFKRLDCQISTASNGDEAISCFGNTWDMVFMDCQMPVLDGFEATRRWRELESHQTPVFHVPIIAFTGENSDVERARCLEAGMDDFVPKPLMIATLHDTLDKWAKTQEIPSSAESRLDLVSEQTNSMDILFTEYQGFESLLRQLALAYAEEWPSTLLLLRDEVIRSNARGVFHLAHKLKGQALTLHFAALTNSIQHLEENAHRGDLKDADLALNALERELKTGIALIERIVHHLDTNPAPLD